MGIVIEVKFMSLGTDANKVKTNKIVEKLRRKSHFLREPCVKAVLLFGSMARGEAGERSDLDLLILHKGLKIKDPIIRRRYLYKLIKELIGSFYENITIIDMELERFLKPKEITALLLNIYFDAVVIYDKTSFIQKFLEKTREKIVKSGLKRIKDDKTYRWMLPEPMKEVKLL